MAASVPHAHPREMMQDYQMAVEEAAREFIDQFLLGQRALAPRSLPRPGRPEHRALTGGLDDDDDGCVPAHVDPWRDKRPSPDQVSMLRHSSTTLR